MGDMADMADMAIEQIEEYEARRADFRCGRMTELQAYEEGIIDGLGYEIGTGGTLKTCRCCKRDGLHWEQRKGKWRLCDNRGIHNCSVMPLPNVESATEKTSGGKDAVNQP